MFRENKLESSLISFRRQHCFRARGFLQAPYSTTNDGSIFTKIKLSAILKGLAFSIQKHFLEHKYVGRILLKNALF